MTTSVRAAAVVAVVALLAVSLVLWRGHGSGSTGPGREPGAAASSGSSGAAAARAFLDRYVDADGRVVRRDQGGDTVSEGQAYAMLLALQAGDRARFDAVWSWTRAHLQRADGLFSWHWADGRVADTSPAADADIDIARALDLAGLHDDARRVADAVLAHETATRGTRLVLLAGPWAASDGVVNPSYFSPCTFSRLQALTGDARWSRLAHDTVTLLDDLTRGGSLPPDWATVDALGDVRPAGQAGGSGDAHYGLDAARVPLRLAACGGGAYNLAARLWPKLRGLDRAGAAVSYSLDGKPATDADHAVGLLGAAAAARAAGSADDAARLYRLAQAQEQSHPTYYGAAWLALAHDLVLGDNGDAGPMVLAAAVTPVDQGASSSSTTSTTAESTTSSSTTSTTSTSTSTSTRSSTTSSSSSTTSTTSDVTGGTGDTPTTTTPPTVARRSPLAQKPDLPALLQPKRRASHPARNTEGVLFVGFPLAALAGLVLGLRERRALRRATAVEGPADWSK